jgi:hypothetical protein
MPCVIETTGQIEELEGLTVGVFSGGGELSGNLLAGGVKVFLVAQSICIGSRLQGRHLLDQTIIYRQLET